MALCEALQPLFSSIIHYAPVQVKCIAKLVMDSEHFISVALLLQEPVVLLINVNHKILTEMVKMYGPVVCQESIITHSGK